MNEINQRVIANLDLNAPAPAFPPLPVIDEGRVRLGGQAPMFVPDIIADAGLVRLGGQSPAF